MKKKGFTLIELLAVIVILALIALIAVPIVLNMIGKARKQAAIDSAYGFIEAVEYNNGLADLEQPGYTKIEDAENIDVTTLTDVKMKGKRPTSGTLTLLKSRVTFAKLCIDNYTVDYDGKKAIISNNNICPSSNGSQQENNPTDPTQNEPSIDQPSGPTTASTEGLAVGDPISYTPSKTDTVTIDTSKTGCQTSSNDYMSSYVPTSIYSDPWRVFSINSDGTVDIIPMQPIGSVCFTDTTGYANYVGYLNELADTFKNTNYSKSTRHFGYKNQTQYITDKSKIDKSSNTMPWSCSTGESCNPDETKGGGDTGYIDDLNKLKNVGFTYTNMGISGPGGLVASRFYEYQSGSDVYFNFRHLTSSTTVNNGHNSNFPALYFIRNTNTWTSGGGSTYGGLIPVITLKSNLTLTRSGSGAPWTISND